MWVQFISPHELIKTSGMVLDPFLHISRCLVPDSLQTFLGGSSSKLDLVRPKLVVWVPDNWTQNEYWPKTETSQHWFLSQYQRRCWFTKGISKLIVLSERRKRENFWTPSDELGSEASTAAASVAFVAHRAIFDCATIVKGTYHTCLSKYIKIKSRATCLIGTCLSS
jgi:hypothetical protein